MMRKIFILCKWKFWGGKKLHIYFDMAELKIVYVWKYIVFLEIHKKRCYDGGRKREGAAKAEVHYHFWRYDPDK